MLVDMIRFMMISNNYAETPRKKNRVVYVLINLKREIKEDTVLVMKTKTPTLNAPLRQNVFHEIKVLHKRK